MNKTIKEISKDKNMHINKKEIRFLDKFIKKTAGKGYDVHESLDCDMKV